MKHFIVILFIISVTKSTTACFCIPKPFCEQLQFNYFNKNNGMVCIAEYTGNSPVQTPNFFAYEMRLIKLLYGEIQPGTPTYMNSDSTFWVLLGSGAACYWDFGFGNDPLLLTPVYTALDDENKQPEIGYALSLCREDVLKIENDSVRIHRFTDDPVKFHIDEFPQLIDDCIVTCDIDLNLTGVHNFPSIFSANSTILSTAEVNSNVTYQANRRISLDIGFGTQAAFSFSATVDGCD